ncbi:hypothetical protein [Paenibacillus sp. PK3_47]|uniref:hypothetical protein n=1 Tax=Paenibacillus sp. PK3_47 TaxID=2072642 RepID=UPI00201E6093|nr:hypothetical protein [Paenibacillus sp. PK3_47]
MKPNNLNGPEEEAAKRRAEEQYREASGKSFKNGIITFIILAVVVVAVFYGFAYFRTN